MTAPDLGGIGALAVGLVLSFSAPLRGQVSVQDLASAVAQEWTLGDVGGLARRMSARGIEVHLAGEVHRGLGVSQARGALARFMETRGAGTATVERIQDLGGQPRKAYAELEWRARDPLAETASYTVFIGFVERGDRWRISEVRVLGSARR